MGGRRRAFDSLLDQTLNEVFVALTLNSIYISQISVRGDWYLVIYFSTIDFSVFSTNQGQILKTVHARVHMLYIFDKRIPAIFFAITGLRRDDDGMMVLKKSGSDQLIN